MGAGRDIGIQRLVALAAASGIYARTAAESIDGIRASLSQFPK